MSGIKYGDLWKNNGPHLRDGRVEIALARGVSLQLLNFFG
jgi:hypothetical protein